MSLLKKGTQHLQHFNGRHDKLIASVMDGEALCSPIRLRLETATSSLVDVSTLKRSTNFQLFQYFKSGTHPE
jgi:hypothetical protein